MKILLIHQYFIEKDNKGGSRFNEMTRVWGELGHSTTVIAGMVDGHSGEKIPKYKGKWFYTEKDFSKNVDVIRTHVSESYNKSFIGRFWAYISFVLSSIWAGLFKVEGKFDVILITSPPLFLGITALTLSKLKKTPFVFEIRDLWPESAIDSGVVQNKHLIRFSYWFEKYIYNKASLINVLTPAFKKNLVEKKGVLANRIIFIPNAADFRISDELFSSFNANDFKEKLGYNSNFVLTYVGAHGVANHLIQLLEVAERLKDTNLVIQLIGDGMQKKWLLKEASSRKLDNVHFVSPLPKKEVFKYILASDMGASVLKKTDTFKTIYSNKTFDYMACKKPILLLIDGVSRELVEKADCGVYAEPENIDEITTKLKFIMNNWSYGKLKQKGENGYNHAKENFDRVVLAEKYLELINVGQ